jgi:2-dehydropantoate 2-reductase
MRIAIVGAGGVGGTLAARLALAGREVWVVARGEHARAIEERGLQLIGHDGTHALDRGAIRRWSPSARRPSTWWSSR